MGHSCVGKRVSVTSVYFRDRQTSEVLCCSPDVYGIVVSIVMQDAPYLVLRLLLIFRYDVISYSNMFFTCKNTLVILLLLYRLVVVQVEKQTPTGDVTSRHDSSAVVIALPGDDVSCDVGAQAKHIVVLNPKSAACHEAVSVSLGGDDVSRLPAFEGTLDPPKRDRRLSVQPIGSPRMTANRRFSAQLNV